MKCSEKERDSCNVEKMGCEGCFYDKDKIEVGEWVRNNGEIGIVKNILKNKILVVEWQNKEKSFYLEYSKDLKHSKNIIDLVKIDDYVNGYRVIGILTNKVNRKKLINVGGKLFNNNDIKLIVAKEQFKAIEYKI